ncbi:MAG: molecular chaperone DnaK, partial [Planctomycetaceae bacterium]|nr:molecular chaperone DnaK [Planctomycetaceae bacterium]
EVRDTFTLSIPGAGSKLIGGALQLEVSREEAQELVLSGFFPRVEFTDRPARRRSGFQEFGLPYAADAAVTRYLAEFLSRHPTVRLANEEEAEIRPDVVLFNGGVFDSPLLRERVLEQLGAWYRPKATTDWKPQLLENSRHDLSVAQGAAYYGLVRRGEGVRISAGLPRTYYVGIGNSGEADDHVAALCVVPAGLEAGEEVTLESQVFELTIATPVEFPLMHSSVRLTDQPGDQIDADPEELTLLPPIRTVLRSRKAREVTTVPVQLHTRLTELGTLEMWCREVDGNRTWQIQFDVRGATQTDREGHTGAGEAAGLVEVATLDEGRQCVAAVFGDAGHATPRELPDKLACVFDLPRDQWPPAVLRSVWEVLMECEPGRRRSAAHEARWLNLLGYSLRPGFGVALDDWRVNETWKQLHGKLVHATPTGIAEWRILWRRIAGGLTAGQQQALATPVVSGLRDQLRRLKGGSGGADKRRGGKGLTQADAELWRMLGSLELLPSSLKVDLGEMALTLLQEDEFATIHSALIWAVGRIGARVPFYGPLNCVVPSDRVRDWIQRLLKQGDVGSTGHFAVMQLARLTGDRYRDLSDAARTESARWLEQHAAAEHLTKLVLEGGELAGEESSQLFGESLPTGLRLR